MTVNVQGVQGSRIVTAQRVDYDTLAVNIPYSFARQYGVLEDYSAPRHGRVRRVVEVDGRTDGAIVPVLAPPDSFFIEWRGGARADALGADPVTAADVPSSFPSGAAPIRIVIRWHDGQLGQELVADVGTGGAVMIPGTSKVDVALRLPPLVAPAAGAIQMDLATGAVLLNNDTPVDQQLAAAAVGTAQTFVIAETTVSAGYDEPSSFPLPLRLTDWLALVPSGPPPVRGFGFVRTPRFARRVRWCSIGIGGAASVQARWAMTDQTTGLAVEVPPPVLSCEIPPDVPVDVPGYAQGIWFDGDSQNTARVDVAWTLQL